MDDFPAIDNNKGKAIIDVEKSPSADNVPLPSTDNATDASSSPDRQSTEKLPSAPEPPRWRFVNEAKKSLGYSSVHAGSYIKGQSSNDLGAKYAAPDISLYQLKEEKVQPKKVEFQLATNKSAAKEDLHVGKLDDGVPSPNAFSNQNNKMGKLTIREADSANDMSAPSGEFAGLPKSRSQQNESRKPFKEWGVSLHVGPKKEREHDVWYDGKTHDSYTMPGGQVPSKTHGEVGKLKFRRNGSGEEAFVGEIPGNSNRGHGDGRGDNESQDGHDAVREGALFVHSGSANGKGTDDSTASTEPTDGDAKKKHKWLYLLLLFLLALVVILGVLLGTRNDDERAVVGAVGGVMLPPVVVVNSSSAPSSYPSASLQPSVTQTLECPVDTKPFSIKHLQHSNRYLATTSNDATWKIKDACSGEVIAQCEPCSLASMFQPQPEDLSAQSQNNDEPTRRLEEMHLGNITECLPIDNEYVLEILPAKESEPCCGFDPSTSIMSYDNVLVNYGASDGSLNSMYFGERETPCRSETPSVSPICSAEQEFNLCLAIDMSGSVCNDGTGTECLGCRAAFLPIFFNSECRDSFVSEDTCCNNFANIKEFASLMVNLLGDFPADKSFSVVQFSTNAQLVSGLASAEQTVPVIDQLDYTGGLTNHASAIQICQQTLPSEDNRKKFIMLVTDGVSSEPGFDPEGAAEAAATAAKSDGTFIIPVFISPDNDWSALSFMRRLSSDGEVFDVTDFDSLNSLQDRLINQVSCSQGIQGS